MSLGRAGLSALLMKLRTSLFHSTTSIFSPFNSSTIFWMRVPRNPTQEPTGSTPGWLANTATFDRCPGSRAMLLTSTVPL